MVFWFNKFSNILFLLISVGFFLDGCGSVRSEPTDSNLETTLPSSDPTLSPLSLLPEHTPVDPTQTPTRVPTPSGPLIYIDVVNNAFINRVVTIPVGTTVVWFQEGGNPHTVTSEDDLFDSQTLTAGKSFFFTFNQPGTYPYYCIIHRNTYMDGVIIVTEN